MYEQYCRAVAETAAWGGQVELGALAALLQRRITVYSVGMPAVDMGPDAPGASPSARQVTRRARPFKAFPQAYCMGKAATWYDLCAAVRRHHSMNSAHE